MIPLCCSPRRAQQGVCVFGGVQTNPEETLQATVAAAFMVTISLVILL